jgi:hypothetical protein
LRIQAAPQTDAQPTSDKVAPVIHPVPTKPPASAVATPSQPTSDEVAPVIHPVPTKPPASAVVTPSIND